MFINRALDKEDVVHRYNGILVIKKKEIMSFASTWMALGIVILREGSQTERHCRMMSLICGVNDSNDHIYETETVSQA